MAIKNPRSRNGVGAKQFVKNMVRGAPPRMWNRLGGPGVTQPVPPPVSENPPVEPPMNYDVKTVSSPGTNPNNAAETPNFLRRQEGGTEADEKQFGGSKWDTWNEQRKRNKDARQRNRDTRQRRRKTKRNKGKYCKQEAGFLDPEIESLD